MSIIKSLQDWLTGFDGMELKPLSEIKTDRAEECPGSYALAPTGDSTIDIDILGNRTYQHSYIFFAKENTGNEIDRQENYDFLDSLSEWIEDQVDDDDLPVLPGRYTAGNIEISNAMLYDLYDDGTGLYQIQIQFTFSKRRN